MKAKERAVELIGFITEDLRGYTSRLETARTNEEAYDSMKSYTGFNNGRYCRAAIWLDEEHLKHSSDRGIRAKAEKAFPRDEGEGLPFRLKSQATIRLTHARCDFTDELIRNAAIDAAIPRVNAEYVSAMQVLTRVASGRSTVGDLKNYRSLRDYNLAFQSHTDRGYRDAEFRRKEAAKTLRVLRAKKRDAQVLRAAISESPNNSEALKLANSMYQSVQDTIDAVRKTERKS